IYVLRLASLFLNGGLTIQPPLHRGIRGVFRNGVSHSSFLILHLETAPVSATSPADISKNNKEERQQSPIYQYIVT
ncbi:MAG: hypothetical protein UHS55_02255, partial [Prevotella sp.]|nr:hypothetical protein [Prevotella sp.]